MKKLIIYLFLILLGFFGHGCATVKVEFEYQNINKLILGETTKDEAIALIGYPIKHEEILTENGQYYHMQYLYAYANLLGTGARELLLEFKNSVLNAYVYASNILNNDMDINFDNANKIKKGLTTKTAIENIIGEPQSRARCPSYLDGFATFGEDAEEVWMWTKFYKIYDLDTPTYMSKTVKVAFDEKGIVSNIYTSQSEHSNE